MKIRNKKIINDSLEFAARWGFVTREIFFEFICPLGRSQQYRYWALLTEDGHFFKSKKEDRVLFLAPKGRAQCRGAARPARHHYYIEHDSIVARVFLALEKRNLIHQSWLEYELMCNPIEAYNILGVDRLTRTPDVLIDLMCADGKVLRLAIEIERVTKSKLRYAKIAMAYNNAKNVDLVIFGCGNPVAERTICAAFSSTTNLNSDRIPGIFQLEDFDPQSLSTKMRIRDSVLTIKQFLELATKSTIHDIGKSSEIQDTSVSLKNSIVSEAA